MPAVNVLIKPASSACNMNCRYCFYQDVSRQRASGFTGMLSLERMEEVIRAAMEDAEGSCTFAFQGGEPTLAGLDFYRQVLDLEQRYAKPGVAVYHSIQTNGYCIDSAWAAFLAENRFLVGLSLDGPADLHNRNRPDRAGKGSWSKVMRAAQLFDKHGVSYNILCVVTGQTARNIQGVYQFFKKKGFSWLQFIPCLEPLGQEHGKAPYSLSPEGYGEFLVKLFDLWFADLKRGEYVSIRHLDNWISMILGNEPEACSMTGCCAVQFVVEGDGGVYPCDFYVLDPWRMGTVGQESFAQMRDGETARRFIAGSRDVPERCRDCEFYPLCRNGCRRERMTPPEGAGETVYCAAYRRFFSQRRRELWLAAEMIRRVSCGLQGPG